MPLSPLLCVPPPPFLSRRAPGVLRGAFTAEEEAALLRHHGEIGNRWAEIARRMQRPENAVKNKWYGLQKSAAKAAAAAQAAAAQAALALLTAAAPGAQHAEAEAEPEAVL
jgi:hypothetical protein